MNDSNIIIQNYESEIAEETATLARAEKLRIKLVREQAIARKLHKDFVQWEIRGLDKHIRDTRKRIKEKTILMTREKHHLKQTQVNIPHRIH